MIDPNLRAHGFEVVDDPVNHPKHYTSHPSGVECITVTEHMNFNIGNAVKYLWRVDGKGDPVQQLQKARWYINREIERLVNTNLETLKKRPRAPRRADGSETTLEAMDAEMGYKRP
jgi:hypothetical protein